MRLTEFQFSYHHENTQCLLSTRNVGVETHFYFEMEGKGRGRGRRDIALTTRVSPARILCQDGAAPVSLATELLGDVYSHGEPQRRKPADRESDLLLESLVAWIKRNRAEADADPRP